MLKGLNRLLAKYLPILIILGFIVFCVRFWNERKLADDVTKEVEKIFKEIK